MIQSTSFLATGSEISFLVSCASDCLRARTRSMARLTAARSSGVVVIVVVAGRGSAAWLVGSFVGADASAGAATASPVASAVVGRGLCWAAGERAALVPGRAAGSGTPGLAAVLSLAFGLVWAVDFGCAAA